MLVLWFVHSSGTHLYSLIEELRIGGGQNFELSPQPENTTTDYTQGVSHLYLRWYPHAISFVDWKCVFLHRIPFLSPAGVPTPNNVTSVISYIDFNI